MPYISYFTGPGDAAQQVMADLIRERRGGDLINLDRMLLHSVPFAEGFNVFLGAVRQRLSLAAPDLELVICAIGGMTNAHYELHHHGPLFLKAGGTPAQLAALYQGYEPHSDDALFDARQRAILALVDESTNGPRASRATIETLQRYFPEPHSVVELVGLVSCYNMVARIILALDIQPET